MTDFYFASTHVGSVPHVSPDELAPRLAGLLEIPAWTQHPRRTFRESMYVQYAATLPGMEVDERNEKIVLNSARDLSPELEAFYSAILSEDADYFALREDQAAGFSAMLRALTDVPGEWAGPVTGPISFGLTVTDRIACTLYDETLADVIVRTWQPPPAGRPDDGQVRPHVIVFLDEPYMASYGSAFISLGRSR
jgi:hypothetical protein